MVEMGIQLEYKWSYGGLIMTKVLTVLLSRHALVYSAMYTKQCLQ